MPDFAQDHDVRFKEAQRALLGERWNDQEATKLVNLVQQGRMMIAHLAVGDRVQKLKGYRWPGVIVAIFQTTAGKTRVVVECTVADVAGALHIYAPEQLERQV